MDSSSPLSSSSTSSLVDSLDQTKSSEATIPEVTTHVIHMAKGKVTKNTVRYEAVSVSDPHHIHTNGSAPAVKTVYVEKWSLGATPPETIDLTLSFSSKRFKK